MEAGLPKSITSGAKFPTARTLLLELYWLMMEPPMKGDSLEDVLRKVLRRRQLVSAASSHIKSKNIEMPLL
jgi:hypothetical protein